MQLGAPCRKAFNCRISNPDPNQSVDAFEAVRGAYGPFSLHRVLRVVAKMDSYAQVLWVQMRMSFRPRWRQRMRYCFNPSISATLPSWRRPGWVAAGILTKFMGCCAKLKNWVVILSYSPQKIYRAVAELWGYVIGPQAIRLHQTATTYCS